ncbi:MAG TPA: NAD(P)/FAD-dependent oxidoreductase [Candidatus Acidoferrum sp.]|nr:NAD(P)/FAD-dependent oxidoreductase [Candidatus Acidoferrum sp.]
MREEYDVIVVGAGPGGSIAARTAAEECEVLLLEKRQEIGSSVRCAGGVDKRELSKFIQPEKKWIVGNAIGARIYAPDGSMFELSGELAGGGVGYVVERKLFDRELANSAARAGAHVMVRTRATGLIKEDDKVQGVKINRLGEDFEVRSRVVIGADGVESKVGRWAGINTTLKLKDIDSCAQYHMTNVDIADDYCDMYLGSCAPGGYAWVFPKGNRTANVGLGVLASKLDGKRPIDYLDEFISKNFPNGQPLELVIGGVPVSNVLKTTIGNGMMLVGDAAHHAYPISGGGIINAMKGGRIAGEVASKAVRQNDASTKVLKEYETMWHSSFGNQLKRSYKVKEFFARLSDEEINKIVGSIQGAKIEEMSAMGIVRRVIKANPKLLLGLRHLL